jgi:hypothetical protein
LFRAFPEDILFDDLFVVVSTLVQRKRLIQEPEAVIYDFGFEKYYRGERIERLARGLLLFLTQHSGMMVKMKFLDYMRFITFKYLKLLAPVLLLIIFSCTSYLLYKYSLTYLALMLLLMGIALFIYDRTRRIMMHAITINYHFLRMIARYFLLRDRSTGWEKLNIDHSVDQVQS